MIEDIASGQIVAPKKEEERTLSSLRNAVFVKLEGNNPPVFGESVQKHRGISSVFEVETALSGRIELLETLFASFQVVDMDI